MENTRYHKHCKSINICTFMIMLNTRSSYLHPFGLVWFGDKAIDVTLASELT